jgi:preprotein translocase subunit SecY
MVSSAQKLASGINLGVLSKAQELKNRIWFAIAALIVYRLGSYIPLPGINPSVLEEIISRNAGGILGMFNMLSGGSLGRMTIFALAIMPYITASIIVQLMTVVSKTLETLKKEGDSGRRKINQYVRYATVCLALFQGFGVAIGLEGMTGHAGSVVLEPGFFFRVTSI